MTHAIKGKLGKILNNIRNTNTYKATYSTFPTARNTNQMNSKIPSTSQNNKDI